MTSAVRAFAEKSHESLCARRRCSINDLDHASNKSLFFELRYDRGQRFAKCRSCRVDRNLATVDQQRKEITLSLRQVPRPISDNSEELQIFDGSMAYTRREVRFRRGKE